MISWYVYQKEPTFVCTHVCVPFSFFLLARVKKKKTFRDTRILRITVTAFTSFGTIVQSARLVHNSLFWNVGDDYVVHSSSTVKLLIRATLRNGHSPSTPSSLETLFVWLLLELRNLLLGILVSLLAIWRYCQKDRYGPRRSRCRMLLGLLAYVFASVLLLARVCRLW